MALANMGFLTQGIGWIIVYGIALYCIYQYKVQLIPVLAVGMNFAWEIVVAILHPDIVFSIGAIMDAFIFVSVFCMPGIGTRVKIWMGILFITVMLLTVTVGNAFWDGWQIIGCGIDVLMAALFIMEILPESGTPWYIRWAAVARLLGDLGAYIARWDSWVIQCFGIVAVALDIAYCVIAFRKPRKPAKRKKLTRGAH